MTGVSFVAHPARAGQFDKGVRLLIRVGSDKSHLVDPQVIVRGLDQMRYVPY